MIRFWMVWLMAVKTTPVASSTFRENNVGLMNRVHLKFAVSHLPPFDVLTLGKDGNYTNRGISPILCKWLTDKLNFTISYYYIPNEYTNAKYGAVSDAAVILNLFADKEIDGSTMGLIATPERKKMIDLAYFMWTEPFNMIVPKPGEEPRLFAFIKPFQSWVWLLIFITMLAVVIFMSLFSKLHLQFYSNGSRHNSPVSSQEMTTIFGRISVYSMYIVNTMTNQGNSVPGARFFSSQMLIGMWLLIATVLVNSYSGTIISYLTVPRMKPPINTFEDLAASQDVSLVLLADNVIGQHILDAKSGVLKILSGHIQNNRGQVLRNIQTISETLETGNYAFPFVTSTYCCVYVYFQLKTFCLNFIASQFKKEGKCRFQDTDPLPFQPGFWSLPLPKNSRHTPMFHYALVELWETGLPQYWVKNALPRAPKCFAKIKFKQNSARQVPIQLNDLTGAFLILGIGVGLATFTFLVEKMYHFICRGNSTTVRYF
ncbi:Uncharacterized protein APZ42_033783 [Daphnia magna]|uniref:Ionotropic glutamate receptor C-terminal domain-containing protein n=1 Tax=Daphnia magna TaxID=35525 RepID=A0A164KVR1_9CRUS|nr:Uncharacterized protein APZ42_033783 [Daphnia magna]